MQALPKILKLKLVLLSFIFPISFLLAGLIIGNNSQLFGITIKSNFMLSFVGSIGFVIGLLLNFVCYYRKLFTTAIYQTPIPLSLFLAFHWVANFFVGNYFAIFIGLIGLGIGLWLNKELVLPYQFYKVPKRILAILYLFYSIVAMGFFMGVPVFNILLGIFAGNYLAMRIMSYSKSEEIRRNINQGSFYSALVILIISIIAGLIALNDVDAYVQLIHQLTNIQLNVDHFLSLLVVFGLTGTIAQYFITKFTAQTMFDFFMHRKIVS
ncbi:MAG: hypothetical protein JEZ09_09060 [Salinivirgaceae bacterium]|nr:hypothetical protein [Salinivirgaceae bacterium]